MPRKYSIMLNWNFQGDEKGGGGGERQRVKPKKPSV